VCGSIVLLVASFLLTHRAWPALTPWRVIVQLIGVAYNFRVLWTPRGWTRFKETYFLKNVMSAVLFVLTCFAYPLAAAGVCASDKLPELVALVLFFVPFELTYEILYDLRDLEGDRAEGISTFPVVHGAIAARRILDTLLACSAAVLAASVALGVLGVRELLMVAAPAVQRAFYLPRFDRGLTTNDCILVTHLGTAQLVLFLVGTALWERAGLPPNIMLGAP
jgi:4-hydroxybenzoate polyprenyltransferase